MEATEHATREDVGTDSPVDDENLRVAALRSSPDRTVFTEDGNSDGWISTDLTVELER